MLGCARPGRQGAGHKRVQPLPHQPLDGQAGARVRGVDQPSARPGDGADGERPGPRPPPASPPRCARPPLPRSARLRVRDGQTSRRRATLLVSGDQGLRTSARAANKVRKRRSSVRSCRRCGSTQACHLCQCLLVMSCIRCGITPDTKVGRK